MDKKKKAFVWSFLNLVLTLRPNRNIISAMADINTTSSEQHKHSSSSGKDGHTHHHRHRHASRKYRKKRAVKTSLLWGSTLSVFLTMLVFMYAGLKGIEDISPLLWKAVPLFIVMGAMLGGANYLYFLYQEKKRHSS